MGKTNRYIKPLRKGLAVELIGNKANSLLFLKSNNFRVPETYILLSDAFDVFKKNREKIFDEINSELILLPDYNYAVRSSASVEDSENFSFAGQFETFINVQGSENIFKAIKGIWMAAIDPIGSEYKNKTGIAEEDFTCAIIIQKMIPSQLSGVGFSKNPVTGQNEIIIEGIEGPGEDLLQKGKTPLRWKLKGDKLIEGHENYRFISVIKKIGRDIKILKRKYGRHIDIEWIFDGRQLYYLQVRPVTAEKHLAVYSNKMAQEMLPGQIKPLVWSVNIPLVNGTWIKIISKITGRISVKPEDLAKSFYYRTYFNVAELGKLFNEFGVPLESLENTMLNESNTKHSFKPGLKTFRHTFRIIKFLGLIFKIDKVFLSEYPEMKKKYLSLSEKITNHFSLSDYHEIMDELYKNGEKLAYFNILIPLLMRIYNKRFSKKLKRLKIDYNLIDFNRDFPELEELSPIGDLYKLNNELNKLPENIRLKCKTYKSLKGSKEAKHIAKGIDQFMLKFGHLSESGNDFSYPKWEEDVEFVYKMIMNSAPHDRAKENIQFTELKYSGILHPRLKSSYLKSGRFKIYREQISSLYISGYGLFRQLFHKLGNVFVEAGLLDDREDIFYLSREEIDEIISNGVGEGKKDWRKEIISRKEEMDECRDLILPTVIYGEVPPIIPQGSIKSFNGVATSSGTFKGKTRIIRSISDFEKVKKGDVIIIPYSDVSWTPILVKAGAIIAESGGMLSHCSIIAREMGIPAMVSVENACSLEDNLHVTVDGLNGILTIHEYESN